MEDFLKTIVESNMNISKTAYEAGYKEGYSKGKVEVWEEVKKDIEKMKRDEKNL